MTPKNYRDRHKRQPDVQHFRDLADSTLLFDPSDNSTLTLRERTLLAMFECDLHSYRRVRQAQLEQIADGYMCIVEKRLGSPRHLKRYRRMQRWNAWRKFFARYQAYVAGMRRSAAA